MKPGGDGSGQNGQDTRIPAIDAAIDMHMNEHEHEHEHSRERDSAKAKHLSVSACLQEALHRPTDRPVAAQGRPVAVSPPRGAEVPRCLPLERRRLALALSSSSLSHGIPQTDQTRQTHLRRHSCCCSALLCSPPPTMQCLRAGRGLDSRPGAASIILSRASRAHPPSRGGGSSSAVLSWSASPPDTTAVHCTDRASAQQAVHCSRKRGID